METLDRPLCDCGVRFDEDKEEENGQNITIQWEFRGHRVGRGVAVGEDFEALEKIQVKMIFIYIFSRQE